MNSILIVLICKFYYMNEYNDSTSEVADDFY